MVCGTFNSTYFFCKIIFGMLTLQYQVYLSTCFDNRGFKALKQTVKLHYRLANFKQMMDAYREMLMYIKSAVTRNYSEKCINNILDFVSGSASQNMELLQEFYQTTLRALEDAKNEVIKSFGQLMLLLLKAPTSLMCLDHVCSGYGLKQI